MEGIGVWEALQALFSFSYIFSGFRFLPPG